MPLSPFSYVGCQNKYTRGGNGDLIITSGQTVYLNGGQIYSYNSIRIDAGGVLSIFGQSGNGSVTEIAVRNSFTLNGAIVCRYHNRTIGDVSFSGNYTLLPTESFSLYTTQALGGGGGGGGRYQMSFSMPAAGSGPAGGSGTGGWGGGGGGGNTWDYVGGYGGSGGSTGQSGQVGGQYTNPGIYPGVGGNAGVGGTEWYRTAGQAATGRIGSYGAGIGGDGANGGGGGGWGSDQNDGGSGAGGGGGNKGNHGGLLMLLLEGTISGNGVIYVNGDTGYNGGAGQDGNNTRIYTCSGGGGGGGAGGSGGKVCVYKSPNATSIPFTVSASGGGGGTGGSTNTGTHTLAFSTGVPFMWGAGAAGGNGASGVAGAGLVVSNKPRV
jgi:hypothetical protein